jgi:hypothetical protein
MINKIIYKKGLDGKYHWSFSNDGIIFNCQNNNIRKIKSRTWSHEYLDKLVEELIGNND